VLFEGNRLLSMKQLEVPKVRVNLIAVKCLRGSIHSRLAVSFGLFQIAKILPLDSFVDRVVLAYALPSSLKSLFTVG
jgi:hypothetical protein